MQNLSSCIVLDDDSADETATAASTASNTKTKSNQLTPFSEPSDNSAHHAKYISPSSTSQSFSGGAGICNPGFNFDDDEMESSAEHTRTGNSSVGMSIIDEGLEILGDDPVSANIPISKSESIVSKSRSDRTPKVSEVSKSKKLGSQSEEPKAKIRKDSSSQKSKTGIADVDAEGDTDEDANSLSLSTVSEASTVVPGEAYSTSDAGMIDKKRFQTPVAVVSQSAIGRRSSVKSQSRRASGEGNVKIVEIKSRDVVQGILRMEPTKLGASMAGRDHIAIVKVPVSMQKQPKQTRSSLNANARQPASSNLGGSGPSKESRDGNFKKVRTLYN